MRRLSKLVAQFLPASPLAAGTLAVLRGLRTGDQRSLLGGAALLAFGWWRSQDGGRQLIHRREVPIGSTVVVRHGREGDLPEIEIHEGAPHGSGKSSRRRR